MKIIFLKFRKIGKFSNYCNKQIIISYVFQILQITKQKTKITKMNNYYNNEVYIPSTMF
jgi:hypothetical protein